MLNKLSIFLMLTTSSAFAEGFHQGRTTVPQINDKDHWEAGKIGDIIFDTSSNSFYGLLDPTLSDGDPEKWASLSGAGRGVTDGSSGVSGEIGERISTYNDGPVYTTLHQACALTFPPGDWEAAASVAFAGGTFSGDAQLAFSSVTASSSGTTPGLDNFINSVPSYNGMTIAMPAKRINITSSQTYYLNVRVGNYSGPAGFYCSISARRMR